MLGWVDLPITHSTLHLLTHARALAAHRSADNLDVFRRRQRRAPPRHLRLDGVDPAQIGEHHGGRVGQRRPHIWRRPRGGLCHNDPRMRHHMHLLGMKHGSMFDKKHGSKEKIAFFFRLSK